MSSSRPVRVLVTGASGFAGSRLIPRLRVAGHHVRALHRDPGLVEETPPGAHGRDGLEEVETVMGDALTGEGLSRALDGVQVAYYLIHSMERTSAIPGPFHEREQLAAHRFAAEAASAGVERIVYLGGLLPRGGTPGGGAANDRGRALSQHLASRLAVERILMQAIPGSVIMRASIVVGARSRSFRLLVHLVERMPVLALPAWRRFRTKPIDARDITEMLAAAATADLAGRTLEVGGPDVLSYGEMITRIAELMLVSRPSVGLGVSLTPITSRLAAAIAGEEPELVVPLMGSLRGDLLPADDRASELLGVKLHSFDSAVERALSEWEDSERLAAW